MKQVTVDMMTEASKITQDVGRLIGSKKGHDKQGFNDLIEALDNVKQAVELARDIEYNL